MSNRWAGVRGWAGVGACSAEGVCGGRNLAKIGFRRPWRPLRAESREERGGREQGKSKWHLHSNEWRCKLEHHRTWVKSVNKLAFGTTTYLWRPRSRSVLISMSVRNSLFRFRFLFRFRSLLNCSEQGSEQGNGGDGAVEALLGFYLHKHS